MVSKSQQWRPDSQRWVVAGGEEVGDSGKHRAIDKQCWYGNILVVVDSDISGWWWGMTENMNQNFNEKI